MLHIIENYLFLGSINTVCQCSGWGRSIFGHLTLSEIREMSMVLDGKLCRNLPPRVWMLWTKFSNGSVNGVSMSYINLEDHRLSRVCYGFCVMPGCCIQRLGLGRVRVVGVNEALRDCKKLQENIFCMLCWLTLKCRIIKHMGLTRSSSGFEPQDWNPYSFLSCLHEFTSTGQVLGIWADKGSAWVFLCSFTPCSLRFAKF